MNASSGRRGNGLASADWGALVDLDPRLSEGLLDRLASAGVAAYVEPAGGTADALSRATPLPGRPLDRLWVDPGRADAARAVVGAEVADLSALLGEQEPGATAHGLVQPVPRTAASRVLTPPPLPAPPLSAPPVQAAPLADPPTTRTGTPGGDAEPPPTPAADSPAGESASAETASADTPATDTPATDPPAADTQATDRQATDTPATDRQATDPPATDPPATDRQATNRQPDPGGTAPLDAEEQWRRIIENYDAAPDVSVPPWPVEEDVEPGPARGRTPRPDVAPLEDDRPRRPQRRRTDRPQDDSGQPGRADREAGDALPGWVEPAPIEDEGGYVPPPPPPVPRVHPRKLAAAAAVVLGVLMMFAPNLLGQGATAGTGLLGLLLTAGGAAALVWWMRDAPPTDSGPDDGAIV